MSNVFCLFLHVQCSKELFKWLRLKLTFSYYLQIQQWLWSSWQNLFEIWPKTLWNCKLQAFLPWFEYFSLFHCLEFPGWAKICTVGSLKVANWPEISAKLYKHIQCLTCWDWTGRVSKEPNLLPNRSHFLPLGRQCSFEWFQYCWDCIAQFLLEKLQKDRK